MEEINQKTRIDLIKTLKKLLNKWNQSRDEKDWLALSRIITEIAARHRLEYEVIVKSEDLKNMPTRGALVRYIPDYDRGKPGKKTETLNNTTETTETLTAGVYYMWTERKGIATSDKNRTVHISKNGQKVTIKETITIDENKVE